MKIAGVSQEGLRQIGLPVETTIYRIPPDPVLVREALFACAVCGVDTHAKTCQEYWEAPNSGPVCKRCKPHAHRWCPECYAWDVYPKVPWWKFWVRV